MGNSQSSAETVNVDERRVRQAAFLDSLRRGATVSDAADAIGVSRRSCYAWRAKDDAFAAAWDRAVQESTQLIRTAQVSDWELELVQLELDLAAIDERLFDLAAPAMAGEVEFTRKRSQLDEERRIKSEQVAALKVAIASGKAHLQRQAAERAEKDRQAHAERAEELKDQQRAAAHAVDEAIAALSKSWAEYTRIRSERATQQRGAGVRVPRKQMIDSLARALFAGARSIADGLRLDRVQSRHAHPLSDETV